MAEVSDIVVGRAVVSGDSNHFGHPMGLIVLAGTELWERISFHGMQALLVLYMVERLLLPGHIEHIIGFARFRDAVESVTGSLSSQALASQIFGLYVGLIYFTPIFGGLLGDRVLGRRRTVALGALLMTAGHFCMAFEQPFLLALLLLILGAGCLRGNLISQVGDLYSKGARRRAAGFQIYYIMINTGAFVAPLITGTLAQAYGWHYGFGFAGFGMLAGLMIYMAGQRHLPPDLPRDVAAVRMRLGARERRVVLFLLLLLPLLTLFWIAQMQVWNTYNLWVRDHVDLMIAGWKMPVPWLPAVDPLAVIVMVPPVLLLWRWQVQRSSEPDDFGKLGIGCLIFGAGMTWLAARTWLPTPQARFPSRGRWDFTSCLISAMSTLPPLPLRCSREPRQPQLTRLWSAFTISPCSQAARSADGSAVFTSDSRQRASGCCTALSTTHATLKYLTPLPLAWFRRQPA